MSFLKQLVRGTPAGSHLENNGSFQDMHEGGYKLASQMGANPRHLRNLAEANRLIVSALKGNSWDRARLKEALTTSDFPIYFGQILDRQLLANYLEVPYSWAAFSKRGTLRDFRVAQRFRFDYADGVLDPVGQVQEYPETYRTEGVYTIQLQKYGRRIPFAWETLINDDLDALKNSPMVLARAARWSEEKYVAGLFANNGTVFTAGNKNIVNSTVLPSAPATAFVNPPLSITGLQNAMLVMASQVDPGGVPIGITAVTLVVPPALEVTANNILHATNIWMNDFGGTFAASGSGATASLSSAQRLLAQNWMQNKVRLAVNYALPQVDTVHGSTGWYLMADPTGRPGIELDFLAGHETPEIFMKASNAIMVGGGNGINMGGGAEASPMDGDFDTDSVHYKIRHIFGGSVMDPIMMVYSNGTNA